MTAMIYQLQINNLLFVFALIIIFLLIKLPLL